MAGSQSAGRPVWSGTISFGMVAIPIKLFLAVREERVSLRMLHDQDKSPIKYKMVSAATGKEVHREHIVKGYEVHSDKFVILSDQDLEQVSPKSSRVIELQDFVDADEIDALYYAKPYYASPEGHAVKPYRLLASALAKANKVGIAHFVMRDKEYLAALRPIENGHGLRLDTMHFAEEVVSPDAVPGLPVKSDVDDREMKVAAQIIESLSREFDPKAHRNEYRERLLALIHKKAEGDEVVAAPPVEDPKPTRSTDLLEVLQASLQRAKTNAQVTTARRAKHQTHQPRRRKSA